MARDVPSSQIVEPRTNALLPPKAFAALLAALAAALVIAVLSYRSLISRSAAADAMNHTKQVQEQTGKVLSALQDGETGQRGYLLTANEHYLEPYEAAHEKVPGLIAVLRQLTIDNPVQQERIAELEAATRNKFDELAETIAHERAGDHAGALAIVRTDRGKAAMDRARGTLDEMLTSEQALLTERTDAWEASVTSRAYVVFGGVGVLVLMIILIGVLASRDYRAVATEAWVRRVQAALVTEIQGDVRLESLGDKILRSLSRNLRAMVGAVFVTEGNQLRRIGGTAVAGDAATTRRLGEGVLGEAAREGTLVYIDKLPADYLKISTGLGEGRPQALALAPAVVDGQVVAVTELAF
ncbi:MAG: CHASE3 domain-containing protein, partial [Kofleriaceae bacterium]